jgi:SEA/GATOR complex protein SEA1/DEPDC5
MEPSFSQVEKVQKLFSLSIHDDNSSNPKDEVIFNPDRFPELKLQPGDLVQISAIREATPSRPSEKRSPNYQQDVSSVKSPKTVLSTFGDSTPGRGIPVKTYDENGALIAGSKDPDLSRSYIFQVQNLTSEQKQKYPNVDLSVFQSVATIFGFRKWMPVLVSMIHEDGNTASHVEITFRDEYLSRADMWRLAVSELSQRMLYRDQKLLFLDTVKATVKNVYMNGEKRKWGFFGRNTKPIFRSESARYVVFIQMSKEMWEFDVEGGGEIMFNKVVNGFLPELFKSWMNIQARHLVTIVLFSRVEYENFEPHSRARSDDDSSASSRPGHRDFYRVVVNDWTSHDWIRILNQLKKEFRVFLRDITIQHSSEEPPFNGQSPIEGIPEYRIIGRPSIASKGNILEAINLASTQFSQDFIDRDLLRTGISIVVVTAGTGIYEVNYSLLKLATDTLISSGIGIDLVCLAPMPLHSVPLFKYRNPRLLDNEGVIHGHHSSDDNTPKQSDISAYISGRSGYALSRQNSRNSNADLVPGEWSYAIPHWIDVSFWKGTVEEQSVLTLKRDSRSIRRKDIFSHKKNFDLRCVLYELEMMGFMQNELTNVGLRHVHEHPMHPWHKLRHRISGRPVEEIDWGELANLDREWMENYDEHVFRPLHQRIAAEKEARRDSMSSSNNRPASLKSISTLIEPHEDVVSPIPSLNRGTVGFLDWKIGRGQEDRMNVPKRRTSILSLASVDRGSIRSFTSGFSRPTAAVAPKADFSHAGMDTKPALILSRAEETAKPSIRPTASWYDQFRSALSRPSRPKESSKASALLAKQAASLESSDSKAKPIDIAKTRKPPMHSRSSSDGQMSSVETVKANTTFVQRSAVPKTVRSDDSGAILNVASNTRRIGPKLSSSGGDAPPIPTTLSPVSALAPWLVLVNPSNPRKNNFNIHSQFRRWQHVFPKKLKASSIKWKSLSSPASVPLTNDFFPSASQLEDEYHQSPYKITQNTDTDLNEAPQSREALVRELIAFRLAHGFQLVVGSAVVEYLGRGSEEVNIFEKEYMTRDGDTVFMTVGSIIHQLSCVSGGGVEIKRFTRKPTAEVETPEGYNLMEYRPYIRTALSSSYNPREISFKKHKFEYNWNYVDSFIAGHEDHLSDQLRFWRARFVFIPAEIPFYNRRALGTVSEDSEEEIRLEGIRKLTHIWNKNRAYSQEERFYQSLRRRKDRNPLMIDYQTRDPSAVIAAGPEGSLTAEVDASAQKPAIFSETEQYSTAHFDPQKLAQDLQGENGIRMADRRWHFKLYHSSFLGSDLTGWLLDRFRDIDTREDAVNFGNELMEKGLFQHVRKEHKFRDGNFFFHVTDHYRIAKHSGSGWFSGRPGPVTPATPGDTPKSVHSPESSIRPRTSSSSDDGDEKITNESGHRKYFLSHVMRYNVDTRKHSYRPEIINLHYDRLHNPDNCFHFRIDWMNVTTKFIEDSIYDWAVHGKKYGLKLVQVPLAEASSITESRPFREPYIIRLALPPPLETPLDSLDTSSFTSHPARDILAVHKAILKRLNFVLDVESANSFPSDVDVEYSWGKNDYKYTQYIHRSGTMLAQITNAGEFMLLPNRLFNDRHATFKLEKIDTNNNSAHQDRRTPSAATPGTAIRNVVNNSPFNSPLLRPVPETQSETAARAAKTLTAEEIKEEVETFCHDEKLLTQFYAEWSRPRSPDPTPFLSTTSLDSIVPNLKLPPRNMAMTTGIGREVSPARPVTGNAESKGT